MTAISIILVILGAVSVGTCYTIQLLEPVAKKIKKS